MSFSKWRHALRAWGQPRFASTDADAFAPSDALTDFDESLQVQASRLQAAKALGQQMGGPRRRWAPVWLAGLFLLCLLAFRAFGVVAWSTVAVAGAIVALSVAVFVGVFKAGRHAPFSERRLKLPIVGVASSCLLLVFYLEPVTQILLAPFLFVTLAYGLLTLSRRAALALCAGILLGYGAVMGLHYGAGRNPALLRLEALHWLALALAMPAFVLLMGRVRLLHQMLHQTSRQIRTIEETAQRDALAGCYNRRHILAVLEEQKQLADESGIPLCMAVLDLDHFKRINDACGHLAGDEVLRTFARLVQQNVRADDILGRYGGEEFLLIFPGTPLLVALNTCERVRAQVESHAWEGWLQGRVTVSTGVTQYVVGESVMEFFARADTAMYLAKEGGRNQVVVEEPVARGAGQPAGTDPQRYETGYF